MENKYIELNAFLKVQGLVATGGKAKLLIRSGLIKVNEEVETRNRRKLHDKDVVEYEDKKYVVEESIIKK